jgi:drug/metabolite transporter (DMT)-like permease
MVLGGIPVLALSFWKQDLAVSGHLGDLTLGDWAGLFYTSAFGSSIATGLFFYNATKGT